MGPPALFRRLLFRAGHGSSALRVLNEVASSRETRRYRGLKEAPSGVPGAPWVHNALLFGGSLRAGWITISALGLRRESQIGPGLVIINYNGHDLPFKDPWASSCSTWASVGNRPFCGPLAKQIPPPIVPHSSAFKSRSQSRAVLGCVARKKAQKHFFN